ncbi:lipocalin-like domain-containing protein [Streptomyces sp. 8L]|uniref:lipocalin-like domain-containing protein n=1 Tax=Streptomyces sp. 8L TaxID=2877242 RepID=UPI001CD1A967|nr:lipocalin-like domain-containing protein [Streptomyces sp. 8L]MCA1224029.1 hypothetical protein [Streptomyces sp. 8L]
MSSARLMSRPEDFEKLGIKPGIVQPWEDGRRDTPAPGHNEVWYFDGAMDDGTKIVVAFRPVDPAGHGDGIDSPNLNVNITTPEGEEFVSMIPVPVENSSIGTEKCEVRFGPHYAVGDLKNYEVKVEPVQGVGVDLHYEALVEPYRAGGTSHVALGDTDEFYYTDQSVPRCRVTGTVTVGGRTWEVTGQGYHDHQWFNISPFAAWHHWLWGRLYTENFTVVIYDFVATERFGFTRIPIFGVLDSSGKVVFDNRGDAEVEVETYHDEQTNKDYPKTSRYMFRDGDTTAEFQIEWSQIIEIRDMYGTSAEQDHYGMGGEEQRKRYDAMGIQPTYMRYYANATLALTKSESSVRESGEMVYEFNYLGLPDARAHL